MRILGCVLFVTALALMFWTGLTIGWGRMLGFADRGDGPALVFEGPYRFVRHPFLLSVELMALAAALVTGRAAAWLIAFLVVAGVKVVAQWEEQRLSEQFGEAYDRYRDATPALYPLMVRGS